MQSFSHNNLSFDKSLLIDWYDGPVISLMRAERTREWMLVFLLGIRLDGEKLFALVPVDEQFATEVEHLTSEERGAKERWSLIQKKIATLRTEYRGNVFLTKVQELGKEIHDLVSVKVDERAIRSKIGGNIETIYADAHSAELFELFEARKLENRQL